MNTDVMDKMDILAEVLSDESRYALCTSSSSYSNATYADSPWCNKSLPMLDFNEDNNGTLSPSPSVVSAVVIQYIVPAIFGLIVVVGFIGNALVVVVVAANQQMRNTTNLLIINLAMADLLFIVFCVPFTGEYVSSSNSWTHSLSHLSCLIIINYL